MKVRLKVDKPLNGKIFKAGWVIGVDQSLAETWIANDEATQVSDDTRTRRYAPTAAVLTVCVDPNTDLPAEKGASKPPPQFLHKEPKED
jgi:hypothetical protein